MYGEGKRLKMRKKEREETSLDEIVKRKTRDLAKMEKREREKEGKRKEH